MDGDYHFVSRLLYLSSVSHNKLICMSCTAGIESDSENPNFAVDSMIPSFSCHPSLPISNLILSLSICSATVSCGKGALDRAKSPRTTSSLIRRPELIRILEYVPEGVRYVML